MKKIFSIILLLTSCQLFSQSINKKWIEVIQLSDQKVYVDTSTIKQMEEQVVCLSISYFNPPKMISALGSEAASIKSQVLFNLTTQKFTTVGTLYYDKNLKILGESSTPGLSVSGESYSTPIDSNQAMVAVYAYCLNYINKGERVIENKDFSRRGDKIKSFLDNKIKIDTSKKNLPAEPIKNSKAIVEEKKNIPPKETSIKTVVDSSVKAINPSVKKNDIIKMLTDKKKNEDSGSVEVSPRSAIFKDGNKFSFQVSSWKNKGKAESEVARLKSQGFNAFIAEAYLAARGGTRYRVRIGCYDSLEEAEANKKKLK